MSKLTILISLLIILTGSAFASKPDHNLEHKSTVVNHLHDQTATVDHDAKVDLIEQLGKSIPLQLQFNDSTGKPVELSQLINRPTLIVPVFYECRNVCNFLLGGLAKVLPDLKLDAGADYNIVTFSIDPSETSAQAAPQQEDFFERHPGPISGRVLALPGRRSNNDPCLD